MGKPQEQGPDQIEDGVEVRNQKNRFTDGLNTTDDLIRKLKIDQRLIIPTSQTDNTPIVGKIISLPTGNTTLVDIEHEITEQDGKRRKAPLTTAVTIGHLLELIKLGEVRIPLSEDRAKELAGFTPEDVTVQGRSLNDLGNVTANLQEEIRLRFPQFLKDQE